MSVQYDPSRKRFVVRWREDDKQRCRRFASQTDAEVFDAEVNPNGRANQTVARAREAAEREGRTRFAALALVVLAVAVCRIALNARRSAVAARCGRRLDASRVGSQVGPRCRS
jgi:hypothetical protein